MKTLKQSLRKKPTYNELVNYIEEDIPIRYPDRTATFLRNSNYLQQFDGDTFIDLEEQENNINKEKLKEMEVRKITAETKTTAQAVRANLTKQEGPKLNVSMIFDTGDDSGDDAYMIDMEEEEQRKLDDDIRKANERTAIGARAVSEATEQEQRSYTSYSILTTPDRPSAPPLSESEYATPIAPRRLEEEFKTPQEESAKKIQTAFRKKKAQEARAKAMTKASETHQKTKDEKFVFKEQSTPGASSSSAMIETPTGDMKKPAGQKPVKARPIPGVSPVQADTGLTPDTVKQKRARSSSDVEKELSKKIDNAQKTFYMNKTELTSKNKVDMLIQIEFRKQELTRRGYKFDSESSVADLKSIVEQNLDLFLTSASKQSVSAIDRAYSAAKSAVKKLTPSKK